MVPLPSFRIEEKEGVYSLLVRGYCCKHESKVCSSWDKFPSYNEIKTAIELALKNERLACFPNEVN